MGKGNNNPPGGSAVLVRRGCFAWRGLGLGGVLLQGLLPALLPLGVVRLVEQQPAQGKLPQDERKVPRQLRSPSAAGSSGWRRANYYCYCFFRKRTFR